jgi:hypothetical protein
VNSVSGILQAQITEADLDFQGDTGGALSITGGETLTISGGNNIHTIGSNNTLTINTNNDINISGLAVSGLATVEDAVVENDLTIHGSLSLPFLTS